jgi:hypothetical protein
VKKRKVNRKKIQRIASSSSSEEGNQAHSTNPPPPIPTEDDYLHVPDDIYEMMVNRKKI